MSSSNPAGCSEVFQVFDDLMAFISSAPATAKDKADAALLELSELPIIVDILNDIKAQDKTSESITGSHNEFYVYNRGVANILRGLAEKMQDVVVAATFLRDLRKISNRTTSTPKDPSPTSIPARPITPTHHAKAFPPASINESASGPLKKPNSSQKRKASDAYVNSEFDKHHFKARRKDATQVAPHFQGQEPKMNYHPTARPSPGAGYVWKTVEEDAIKKNTFRVSYAKMMREAFLWIQNVMGPQGLETFRSLWETDDPCLLSFEQRDKSWPEALDRYDSPAFRNFRGYFVQPCARNKNFYAYYTSATYYHFTALLSEHLSRRNFAVLEQTSYIAKLVAISEILPSYRAIGSEVLDAVTPCKTAPIHNLRSRSGGRIELLLAQKLPIMVDTFGPGFLVLMSTDFREGLSRIPYLVLQHIVNCIKASMDRSLFLKIQEACAEAQRLMHVIECGEDRKDHTLEKLESLIGELTVST